MSNLVFSAQRASVDFTLTLSNGKEVVCKWLEPNAEITAKMMEIGKNPENVISLIKEVLEANLDCNNKDIKKMVIKDLMENMGVNELFDMFSKLNDAVADKRKKK